MRLVVVLEQRFERTADGRVWTTSPFHGSFWSRYTAIFDRILVVARQRPVDVPPVDARRVDSDTVCFATVPDYRGPQQYLTRAMRVRREVLRAPGPEDAILFRVGSQLASVLEPRLRQSRRPYGVEVVGDPYDVFAPGVVAHPLRPFFRWWFSRMLRRQCRNACSAAYVTRSTLQRRYPPAPGAFSTHYSSIDLPTSAFVESPRGGITPGRLPTLILVGSLAQLYKGPDTLLRAIQLCSARGTAARLVVVGEGRFRPEMESLSRELGLCERVEFRGALPAGQAIARELDAADLFVLPSRTEGLPRAMIEAMARALPCIGSSVGGIPELLSPDDLVPPDSPAALADKICEVLGDPSRMARMSARNLEVARGYRDDVLQERRVAFYRHLEQKTADWARSRGRGR